MADPDAATAAWNVQVERGCNISRGDIAAMLDASRPLIEAEAAARERQRIFNSGAIKHYHDSDGWCYCVPADLLDGDVDAR